MTTLAEIFNLDPDLLYRKFDLEPCYRYDPRQKENLIFLSPTVLLQDLQLRDGGYKDRGAKEVLARLTKDILNSKTSEQCVLFQVPEIPYVHMGYGKASENKKHNMAITENEAKVWMNFLDLSRHKKPGEVLREGESPMEEDVTFPTAKDTQAFEFERGDTEELVDPSNSGLKRRVKGSYLLFFSILLIFFDKKNPRKNPPLAPTSKYKVKIGANKISDFILFWILPYLINFTHQKVNAINEHHKGKSEKEGVPVFTVRTVEKSAMDILQDAIQSCKVPLKLEKPLLEKYRKYYSSDQLNCKYNLPATKGHTPIILVPLGYQVNDMPVEIEDLGTKWREIGDVRLVDEFVNKFIENEEIQTDFLHSIGYLKDTFATDYGILLPDEDTFSELVKQIEDEHPDIFRHLPCQGRHLDVRLGLVKHTERNQSVCFSYFPEHSNGSNIASLFRVIGSRRVNHFTLVVLHGACINSSDPHCKLLSLYPVKSCRKFSFQSGKLQKERNLGEEDEKNFEEGVGRFCSIDFPEAFNSWEQAICSDSVVKKFVSQSRNKLNYPNYHCNSLVVAYTKKRHCKKLKEIPFGAALAQTSQDQDQEKQIRLLEKYHTRAANLNGSLLSMISRRGNPKNVGVVLAINDTLGPHGACLPNLPAAMRRVIAFFVMAVVVAGLPDVYPPKANEEDVGGYVESGSSEEDDDDESSDDEQPATSAGASSSSGESGIAASNSSSATAPRIKEGIPDNYVLSELADDVMGTSWKKLGRMLKVQERKLTQLEKDYAQDTYEQAFKMLLHWKESNADAATYQILFNALTKVDCSSLAKKFCCIE